MGVVPARAKGLVVDDWDALWREAPGPAVRQWSEGPNTRVEPNAAARLWASRADPGWADWAALAQAAGQGQPRFAMPGGGQAAVSLRRVPVPGGAVVWIVPDTYAADPVVTAGEVLELLQQHGHIGSVLRDLDSGEGRWDARTFEIMGLDPAAGTPDFDASVQLVHPDDRVAFLKAHRQRMSLGGRYSVRFRVLRPDGGLRYLHSVYEVLPAAQGVGRRLLSLLIDETESVERYQHQFDDSLRLNQAVELAALSVWQTDLATQRFTCNAPGWRSLGLPPQPEGMPIEQLRERVHPADVQSVREAAEQALREPRVVDLMARYTDGHGHWRHQLTRRVALRDAHGRPLALLGVSLDMTELMQEKDRSLALLDRMQLVAETIGVGFWWRDLDLGVLEWDDMMYRLHHRDPAEGTPSLDEFLLRHVHPLDQALLHERQDQHIAQWPAQSELTFRILTPGGELRWIQSWTRRVWREGRRLSFGMHVDVTAEREAMGQAQRERERDRFAIEAAGVGVWDWPLDGSASHWSASMYRLLGLSPTDPRPHGALLRSLLSAAHRANAELAVRRCAEEGCEYRQEYEVHQPSGERRWLLSVGRLVRDERGQPQAITGVALDITERRQAEHLARERDRAEQASAAKSELMARVSHELRTPMNAVLGFTELMALDGLSPAQGERLARIQSAGQHLLGLIDDVLTLSQGGAGRPAEREPLNLSLLLAEALQWVAPMAEKAGVRVVAPAGLQADPWVLSDRRRLGQVLINLLTNAIKYNRPGGHVWLTIAAAPAADSLSAWRLVVRDDGRGMAPEQLVRLFEPFNRLGAEREGIPGTGIGLAIVRQLTQDLGIGLEVRSQWGLGSAFDLLLPAASPEAVASAETKANAEVASAPAVPSGPVTVVYVEDNPINEMLVRQMLSLRPRFVLHSAEDGQTGIELVRRLRPAIVLLDLQLPDQSGLEVLASLRGQAELAQSHFIALSANAMPDDVQAALDAGFEAYWTKPLDLQQFLARMDALADGG